MSNELDNLRNAVAANTSKTGEVVAAIDELKAGAGSEEIQAAADEIRSNTDALSNAIGSPVNPDTGAFTSDPYPANPGNDPRPSGAFTGRDLPTARSTGQPADRSTVESREQAASRKHAEVTANQRAAAAKRARR